MYPAQTRNGRAIMFAVNDIGRRRGWSARDRRYVCYLAIMCAMDESGLWIYANSGIPESLQLPHEQVGNDHASVGLFQQQVPMWGSVADCMDTAKSTGKFVNGLIGRGLIHYSSTPRPWQRIQAVQNSATPDGSNYKRYQARAYAFVVRYWNPFTGAPRGKRV